MSRKLSQDHLAIGHSTVHVLDPQQPGIYTFGCKTYVLQCVCSQLAKWSPQCVQQTQACLGILTCQSIKTKQTGQQAINMNRYANFLVTYLVLFDRPHPTHLSVPLHTAMHPITAARVKNPSSFSQIAQFLCHVLSNCALAAKASAHATELNCMNTESVNLS